jgi:hypothetical protein
MCFLSNGLGEFGDYRKCDNGVHDDRSLSWNGHINITVISVYFSNNSRLYMLLLNVIEYHLHWFDLGL